MCWDPPFVTAISLPVIACVALLVHTIRYPTAFVQALGTLLKVRIRGSAENRLGAWLRQAWSVVDMGR